MGSASSTKAKTNVNSQQKLVIEMDNRIINNICTDVCTSVQQKLTESTYNLTTNQTGIFINNTAIGGNLNINNVNINSNNVIDINIMQQLEFKTQLINNISTEIASYTQSVLEQTITSGVKDLIEAKANTNADTGIAISVSDTAQTYTIKSEYLAEITSVMENFIKNSVRNQLQNDIDSKTIVETINQSGIFLDNVSIGGNLTINGGNITSVNKINATIIKKLKITTSIVNSVESASQGTIVVEEIVDSLNNIASESAIAPTTSGSMNGIMNTFAKALSIPEKLFGIVVGGIVLIVAILGYTIVQVARAIFQPDVLKSIEGLVPKSGTPLKKGKGELSTEQNKNHNMALLKINDLLNLNEITEKFSCYQFN